MRRPERKKDDSLFEIPFDFDIVLPSNGVHYGPIEGISYPSRQ